MGATARTADGVRRVGVLLSAPVVVVLTGLPAHGAWQGAATTTSTVSSARLSAEFAARPGVSADRATWSTSTLAGVLSAEHLAVTNTSSVPTTLVLTLRSSSLVSLGGQLEACSTAWTVTAVSATCGGSVLPLTSAAAGQAWTTPAMAPGTGAHLRLRWTATAVTTLTLSAAAAAPPGRDRTTS